MATRQKPKSKRKQMNEAHTEQDGKRILFIIIGVAVVLLILLYSLFQSVVG